MSILSSFRLLAASGVLLATQSATASSQSPTSDERAAFIERRIQEVSSETSKIVKSLKDGQIIISYYNIITKNFSDYVAAFQIYDVNCSKRRLEYEEMRRTNNPFHERLRAPVQRCNADRADFNASIRITSDSLKGIERDVEQIIKEVERLKIENERTEAERRVFELELNLRRSTKDLLDKTQNYKRPGF